MIKYNFQIKANSQDERIKINKQVNRYFSEIMDLKEIKKFHPEEQKFLILLGGKNVGKSYWAIKQGLEIIKNGGRLCYMRNSLDEIKAIKTTLGELVSQTIGKPVKISNETITDEDRTRIYINFVQSKNYNKLSGNLIGYDMLIYDEFNQIIKGTGNITIAHNFLSIINTIFRNKPLKVVACGNTTTKNNVFFNMFKISPKNISSKIEIIKKKDYPILFINYHQSAFKEINGDIEGYNIFKKLNPKDYKQMIEGSNYNREDEHIINNFELIINDFSFINKIIIYDNDFYGIYESLENKGVWFIHKENNIDINLEILQRLKSLGCEIYGVRPEDYINESSSVYDFEDGNIAHTLLIKMKQYKLFFDNYEIFTIIQQRHTDISKFFKSLNNF